MAQLYVKGKFQGVEITAKGQVKIGLGEGFRPIVINVKKERQPFYEKMQKGQQLEIPVYPSVFKDNVYYYEQTN